MSDAFNLGVLSSRLHTAWALATGSWLGVGNDPVYVNSRYFETFPFPDEDTGLSPALRARIVALAEQIDAHRKRQQAAHPGLALTGMHNVLEALRQARGERGGVEDERVLTAKEKAIHTQGLVGVLKELHDELDAAVLQAYGLDYSLEPGLSTDALLTHLVALNASRALEEKAGHVRWLRPKFQNPSTPTTTSSLLNQEQSGQALPGLQADLALDLPAQTVFQASSAAQPWAGTLPEQVRAVAQVLASANAAMPLAAIEARFKGKGPWKKACPAFWKRSKRWDVRGVRAMATIGAVKHLTGIAILIQKIYLTGRWFMRTSRLNGRINPPQPSRQEIETVHGLIAF